MRLPARPAEVDPAIPSIDVAVRHFEGGRKAYPAFPHALLVMHLGTPNRVVCRRAGFTHAGTELDGDIDLIPPGIASEWEGRTGSRALVLGITQPLLASVGLALGLDPDRVRVANRFQLRDPQLEHLARALQHDMEAGCPSGRLVRDALATAVSALLLQRYPHGSPARSLPRAALARSRLSAVLEHIERHLDTDLALADLAAVAGLSVSHFKVLFRRATGSPVHRYVLRRRVELAARLLAESTLPISEVALATGFASQSHLALHLRRMAGTTPARLRRRST